MTFKFVYFLRTSAETICSSPNHPNIPPSGDFTASTLHVLWPIHFTIICTVIPYPNRVPITGLPMRMQNEIS